MEKHFFSLRQMQNLLIYPHFKTFMVDNVQVGPVQTSRHRGWAHHRLLERTRFPPRSHVPFPATRTVLGAQKPAEAACPRVRARLESSERWEGLPVTGRKDRSEPAVCQSTATQTARPDHGRADSRSVLCRCGSRGGRQVCCAQRSAASVKFYGNRKMSSTAVAVVVFGDILLIFVAVILAAMAIRAAVRQILSDGQVVPATHGCSRRANCV